MTRPDKHDPRTLAEATWAVHGGNAPDAGTGAVRRPLVMANSYLLPEDATTVDWSNPTQLLYTRTTGANQQALEEKLAALEGGDAAIVVASGVAALHAVFFSRLRSGDHIVVSDVTYEAVWRLFTDLLPQRYGIEATFVDVSDLDQVRAAIRPNTRLIHTETIANPTTKVADIAALAEIAHGRGLLLVVDNTFTPPSLYRPLADGADVVIHSLTKYINGHGDAMGGAIIGGADLIGEIRSDSLADLGAVISPFNAWMILRGSVTLPLRLRQHVSSAQKVAEFLESDDRVAFVAYPGLASHPDHELAVRQFGDRGFGGVLAFALAGDTALRNRFVAELKVITSAVSLGHDESLIVHVGPHGRGGAEHYPAHFRDYGHLRLAVGLEDPADLIADLAAALDVVLPRP